MGILQHCQVSIACGSCTGVHFPVTPLLPCLLEHDQMASCCCRAAHLLGWSDALLTQPLQHFQLAFFGCVAAQRLVQKPRELVSPVLQELQIPSLGSC